MYAEIHGVAPWSTPGQGSTVLVDEADETADAMDLSPRKVKRDWAFARAWLYGALMPEG